MSTNVRVKKITTASNEAVGRSNVYHDIFNGDNLIDSILVGKLRKVRGTAGYDAFVMTADGSRTALGNFGTRSGAAHEARKIYRETVGLPGKTASAPKAKTAKVVTLSGDEKRDERNARRRAKRAADAAAKVAANG